MQTLQDEYKSIQQANWGRKLQYCFLKQMQCYQCHMSDYIQVFITPWSCNISLQLCKYNDTNWDNHTNMSSKTQAWCNNPLYSDILSFTLVILRGLIKVSVSAAETPIIFQVMKLKYRISGQLFPNHIYASYLCNHFHSSLKMWSNLKLNIHLKLHSFLKNPQ